MRQPCCTVSVGLLSIFALSTLYPFGGTPLGEGAGRRASHLQWGLYQILWSRAFCEQLEGELAKFASKPDYVTFYRDLSRPFPKSPIDCIARHGATTIVSLELHTWHGGNHGSHLTAINAGEYDEFFRRWARDALADGRRVLLRFGFEFNGDWFSWSGDSEAYVAAWRRIHDLFDKAGARNVEWVWAPNVVSCPDNPANNMHRYYPGDEFVDWIGVDGYNFGDHHDKWHKWQSFDEVFGPVLKELSARYASKPFMITEFGCAPGRPGQRDGWIRDAYETLRGVPLVRAVIWFNYDKRREGEPDWRIDATAASLDAFNRTFSAPPKQRVR